MLPKEKRIRNTKDFKRVYQRGSFFSVPLFNVNYLGNKTNVTRLGIVVSKKTEPKATKRNEIKRKIREASKALYENFPKGYDIIINIKKEAMGQAFSKIEEEVKKAAQRVR